jgi:glucose/arabinose dehydrogenase
MRRALMFTGMVTAAVMLISASVQAQVKVKLQEVAGGLTHPLAMVPIPDGTGRMAVIEQTGQVRIMDTRGRLLPDPFLDVSGKIIKLHSFFDERGLLGIAFHPSFRENGKFYISYSAPLRGTALDRKLWWSHTNVTSEFIVSKADPNKADPNYERVVSEIDWPQFNHNGHWIGFGPDGMLYISTGDGGYANDWGIGHNVTIGNAQDMNSIHGKMLRIDVNKPDGIAADNPFVGRSEVKPQIWASGLRNAWRCSFDMGGTKELFCADVQQNSYEEVNIITKGGNYGWRLMEGDRCFNYQEPDKHPAACEKANLIEPIMVYPNCTAVKANCMGISITGGYVYRGANKAWEGKYIFGDWSKSFGTMDGQIIIGTKGTDGKWKMEKAQIEGMETAPYMLAFAQDDKGEVYALTSITTGPASGHDKIYKIVAAN